MKTTREKCIELASQLMCGADPEIFVESNGEMLPAFLFLPSKDDAKPLKTGESQYWDGFQAETTIIPSTSIPSVLDSIKRSLKSILTAAKAKFPESKLSTQNVWKVDLKELAELPEQYVIFGCMPSINAYDLTGQHLEGQFCEHRYSGGHVHLSTVDHSRSRDVARVLDSILGVVGVSLFSSVDQAERRKAYGLSGEIREPIYKGGIQGIEYRTLSSAWVSSPITANLILDLARKTTAYSLLNENRWATSTAEVIETINLCQADRARDIIRRNQHLFADMGFDSGAINLLRPIEESVPSTDIAANWRL